VKWDLGWLKDLKADKSLLTVTWQGGMLMTCKCVAWQQLLAHFTPRSLKVPKLLWVLLMLGCRLRQTCGLVFYQGSRRAVWALNLTVGSCSPSHPPLVPCGAQVQKGSRWWGNKCPLPHC